MSETRATNPFKKFFALESAGGIVLFLVAVLALLCANSPLAEAYHAFVHFPLGISLGGIGFSAPLELWINDGLMAIFFLLVGMEIKRELLEGELSSLGQAVLPFFAAVGGVALPAVIYVCFNWEHPENMRGWAIPTATDIAFSIGVLALFGSRLSLGLKVFLTAVAVIDDLIAIVVIAVFYTSEISEQNLLMAALCLLALAVFNRRKVNLYWPYLLVGALMWYFTLKSGIHATIAGVMLGAMMPLKLERHGSGSMLKYLEHLLQPWVVFFIMPIFAFANAGINFEGITLASLADPVPAGIAVGLFAGKQIGIFTTALILIKLGIARLPEGATWAQFYLVCMIAGIGFTMSLFVGGLAFQDAQHATSIRLGVMLGSLASAIVGGALLHFTLRKPKTL
ncbi:MAG: Na+/H+ antiporter NhaA [Rickettsiales bacterium]